MVVNGNTQVNHQGECLLFDSGYDGNHGVVRNFRKLFLCAVSFD